MYQELKGISGIAIREHRIKEDKWYGYNYKRAWEQEATTVRNHQSDINEDKLDVEGLNEIDLVLGSELQRWLPSLHVLL